MLLGAFYEAVLGAAAMLFEGNNRQSVDAAVRLVPYNSTYLVRLAGWETPSANAILKRAVSLNPYEVQAWLQLGFDAEFHRHDQRAAENAYLQAAQVNHMFLPRSTLANFYFRRDNGAESLKWAKAALSITPYPPAPTFSQMWLLDPNPARLAEYIPDRPEILSQYAGFLMNAAQFDAIPPILKRLAAVAGKEDPERYGLSDTIGLIEDRLLGAGYSEIALQIWSIIGSAGWVRFPLPSAASPLTNGNFRVPIWGHGFDWSAISNGIVFANQDTGAGEMRFDFSGDEPEQLVLLQQWVPVEPGRRYRLKWKATASGLETPAGVTWRLHTGQAEPTSADILADDAGSWVFEAPKAGRPCLLTLEYSRPVGQTRANGTLAVGSVAMQLEKLSGADR